MIYTSLCFVPIIERRLNDVIHHFSKMFYQKYFFILSIYSCIIEVWKKLLKNIFLSF